MASILSRGSITSSPAHAASEKIRLSNHLSRANEKRGRSLACLKVSNQFARKSWADACYGDLVCDRIQPSDSSAIVRTALSSRNSPTELLEVPAKQGRNRAPARQVTASDFRLSVATVRHAIPWKKASLTPDRSIVYKKSSSLPSGDCHEPKRRDAKAMAERLFHPLPW